MKKRHSNWRNWPSYKNRPRGNQPRKCLTCEKVYKPVNGRQQKCKDCTKVVPIYLDCFSCKKTFKRAHRQRRFAKVPLCGKCFKRYFIRKTGTLIEGMDWVREVVRIRDNHTCQDCGVEWVYGKRRFDIHHLGGLCGKLSRSYDWLENIHLLTTLCHRCHLNLPEVREKMSQRSSPRKERDKEYCYENRDRINQKQVERRARQKKL